ncbi:PHP domain-containing protein [Eubacteriales bacterium OttesenSCG-928-G02]|nr:PHP domain-containing protein [Eubacteriales bacterium OttesenSCG-928-G02]
MNKYFYDLHIHSALSSCADDDMTPNNIAGMAMLNGLNLIALTDHNSCGNCEAFFKACSKQGIIPIAGMELTTAEEIHMVCLFEFLEEALEFDKALDEYRIKIKNKAEVFGNQLYIDKDDNITGTEDYYLTVATMLNLDDSVKLVKQYNGFIYPAHVERTSNGIISILGTLPDEPYFDIIEFADTAKIEELTAKKPELKDKRILTGSDAHNLWTINEAENFLEIDDEPYSSAYVRKQFFKYLRGEA